MTAVIETVRQFINTWECDENAHLNVQFYFLHFDTASRHFLLHTGLSGQSIVFLSETQHVRFHRELAAGDLIVVNSHLAGNGDGHALCHIMRDAETNGLVATSWAPIRNNSDGLKKEMSVPITDAIAEVLPRSFDAGPAPALSVQQAIASGFACCLKSQVLPGDCNADGIATSKGIVANLSNSAAHFWNHIGLNKTWLNKNNYGRVAIEFKLDWRNPIPAGTPITVYSGLTGFTGKTISFRHYVFDAATRNVALIAEVAGLAIDQNTRKAVTWGDDAMAILNERLIDRPGG